MKDKKYYDDFFKTHDVDVHNSPDRFLAVSKLLSGKVLDVACGTGTLSDYFLGDYIGVDVSDVAISAVLSLVAVSTETTTRSTCSRALKIARSMPFSSSLTIITKDIKFSF